MQTSRFQFELTTGLALCLGYVLSSHEAIGYPAGAAVSFGSSPIRSFAGTVSMDGSELLDTIPTGQDFIVTDISLAGQSLDFDCMDLINVDLVTDTAVVASFSISTPYCTGAQCFPDEQSGIHSLRSGIRVPGGETLRISTSNHNTYTYHSCSGSRNTRTRYTVSGYFAQP